MVNVSRVFFLLAVLLSGGQALAQCVSLTTTGAAYTQNFDTLSNTAGPATNNLTIPGWFMTESGGGLRDNEQYAVDTGASTTGDTYSYGAAGSTERALGSLRAGTLIPIVGACFTNNTGSTISSLDVSYTGEQWRLGTAGRTDQINFEYSSNATDLVTGTWTGVVALNFVTPNISIVNAKDGNAAPNRTVLSSSVSALSIPNGATFWIRWTDTDASGADDGLAVDDFSLTPQSAPLPPNISVNDVSLSEGNAGTTTFTFTVSLSAPAGAGGVTFDIATADGTAVSSAGDYTARSLTGQTIPAGSSTYSFSVSVAGDTAVEANETFFVNVTNVTGATVTDGQGQGTIANDDVAADLSITMTDGVATAMPGGSVTYTLIASNAGPGNAPGSTVVDTLPAVLTGTWTCVGAGGATCTAAGSGNISDTVNLPAGGSVTYTVAATISAGATGTLVNTATVSAPGGVTDPNPANNSATDSDALVPRTALLSNIPTRQGGVTASLSVNGCSTISRAAFVDAPPGAGGAQFPFGLIDFSLGSCSGAVSVTVTYNQNLPAGAVFYKEQGGSYSTYPATLGANSVSFSITDNGPGDSNPAVGVIDDPSGIGVAAAPSLTAVPTLSEWGALVLSALVALLALGARQRRA